MTGNDFVKKLKCLGRKKQITITIRTTRGKGSHQTLFYGKRFTTIPDLRRELSKGLQNALLKQLGIDPQEFREI